MKNLKKFCLLVLFFLSINFLLAEAVNVTTIKNVAVNCFRERFTEHTHYQIDKLIPQKHHDKTLFYIVTFQPKGFVVVSADNIIKPIIGFSNQSRYNSSNQPPAFKLYVLERTKRIIEAAIENNLTATPKVKSQWEKLNKPAESFIKNSYRSIGPLLTTVWAQGTFFNTSCPADTAGPDNHVVTGCVATAMAQVLNYWNHPWHGEGSHSYNEGGYGILSADFENTRYNYDNMPDTVTAYNNDVATLMYHCGVAVEMDYGPDGSGASGWNSDDIPDALQNYFYFDNSVEEIVRSSHAVTWTDKMQNNLDNHRPVIYGATDVITGEDNVGHAWVLDGYTTGEYFHCNWGWGGDFDGWFSIDDFSPGSEYTFDMYEDAVVKIKPKTNNLNETWTAAESPYYIDYDQIIDSGDQLIIEPGVEILFRGRYQIKVLGSIVAEGSPLDSINFNVDNSVFNWHPIGWRGIRFYDTNEASEDSSFFSYCNFIRGKARRRFHYGMESLEEDYGGAIYCNNSSAVKIENCIFRLNYADASGGAICLKDTSNIIINDCEISFNTAESQGGGINCIESDLILSGLNVENNTSVYTSGGGLYFDDSDFNMEDSFVANNEATFGGGIYIRTSLTETVSPYLKNVIIFSNDASAQGGGILSEYNSNPTLDSVYIENNYAENEGGGAFFHSGSPILANVKISGNHSTTSDGGGIELRSTPSSVVNNNKIYQNTS